MPRRPKADGLDMLEIARERLGESPEGQLRKVVDFAQKDLRALYPDERTAIGYMLKALPSPMVSETQLAPLPDDVVRRIQRRVQKGLAALMSDERSFVAQLSDRKSGWGGFPPLPRNRRLIRMNDPNNPERKRVPIRWVSNAESEFESIMAAIGELFVTAGTSLRQCPICEATFVARKRQEYCSTQCSQRTRDRRRRPNVKIAGRKRP